MEGSAWQTLPQAALALEPGTKLKMMSAPSTQIMTMMLTKDKQLMYCQLWYIIA